MVQATGGSVASHTSGQGDDGQEKRRQSAIEDTIMGGGGICFEGVAGLSFAKQALREAIILPLQYPHLFTGGRRPWRCVLLYGPPGTGKTRLAQAVSSEAESTFYCVSSSDLLSSWVGESEKIIRDLFQHARKRHGQSVVFIDEVDSLCRARNSSEEEHTRRVKTELLRQMEGADTPLTGGGGVFLLCATNTPWELDPAFIRRCQRRIYIPLPNRTARQQLFSLHLSHTPCHMTKADWDTLLCQTDGFSGSDIATCVADALMEPVRELEHTTHWKLTTPTNKSYSEGGELSSPPSGCGPVYVPCDPVDVGAEALSISDLLPQQVCPRPVCLLDLLKALERSHRTVSPEALERYQQFTLKFGQSGT
ncbi:vacuolar protein sorting-associated protein 4A-like isoform X2 [Halichondria panicea]